MLQKIEENVLCAVGGVSVQEDIERLRKHPNIVVGTPARINHFTTDRLMNFSKVKLFVMDEADKLICDEFLTDVNCIIQKLPRGC